MINVQKTGTLCFSIPELEADTHTHHFHIYELLEEIGKQIRVFVVVDKHTINKYYLSNIENIYFTRFDFFPVRKIEQFLIFCYARLKGFKTFYIHYSLWNAIIIAFITRIFGGKTLLWSCHVHKRTKLNEIESSSALRRWFYGILKVFTFKVVDHIVTGSSSVASFYIKEFDVPKNKFIIIPNWVNLNRFQTLDWKPKERKDGNKTVIFIHSLTEEKGAQYLPGIIKSVINEINNVKFTIIGDGIYRDFVKEEVIKNGFDDKVEFIGYISNKGIPKYLSCADLLIIPSKNEGFPRVLIESMAMGVPFVATNAGGIMDIVFPPQTEYIVQNGDMKSFSKKVIGLLKDDAMREKLRDVGLERVKEYTLEKAVERFKKIVS